MNAKDKPWLLLDTHAGAGLYAIDSEQAKKTGEYIDGIARLWNRVDLPAPMKPYMDALQACNGGLKLRRYPGSPWLAAHFARDIDTCASANCTRPISPCCGASSRTPDVASRSNRATASKP
jgi:23S rRNA (adenine2030-N6)-methyltransferase